MDSASVFSRLKEGPKGLAALQTCSKVQSYALWPSGGHLALRGLRANRFLGSRLRTKRMETYGAGGQISGESLHDVQTAPFPQSPSL